MEEADTHRSYHLRPIEAKLAQFARYAAPRDHQAADRRSQIAGWEVQPAVLPIKHALFPQKWTKLVRNQQLVRSNERPLQKLHRSIAFQARLAHNKSSQLRTKTQEPIKRCQKTQVMRDPVREVDTEEMFGLLRRRYQSQPIRRPKESQNSHKGREHSRSKSTADEILPLLYASNQMYLPSNKLRANPYNEFSPPKRAERRRIGAQIREAIMKRIEDRLNPQLPLNISIRL